MIGNPFSGSIRRKLLFFLLLVGILPGLLYLIVTWQGMSSALKNSIGNNFKQAAKVTADQVADKFDKEIAEANVLARSPDLAPALERATRVYANLTEAQAQQKAAATASTVLRKTDARDPFGRPTSEFHQIDGRLEYYGNTDPDEYYRFLVTDSWGTLVTITKGQAPFYLGDTAWWKAAFDEGRGRPFIGNLHYDKALQTHVVDLAVPIYNDSATAVRGLLIMELKLHSMFRDLTDVKYAPPSHITLFDSRGHVVLEHARMMQRVFEPAVLRQLVTRTPKWVQAKDDQGREAIVGVAPVSVGDFATDLFNRTTWYVMVPQRLDLAYAPLNQLIDRLIWLGLLVILGIVGIGLQRINKIAKPLKRLSHAARAIGAGNLNYYVDLRTNDEVEHLADEFNRMAVALKASQENLEQANLELDTASRLKSEFLANMSHELRTPLNSIIGFAEVLTDQLFGSLNDKQKKYVANIHSSGQHLLELINDILDLSKIESGKVELNYHQFPVRKALRDSQTVIKPLADRKSLKIETRVESGLDTITADEAKFKQIMYNLLSNAVKFTPTGGRITVYARRNNDMAQVSVADTGIGIANHDQNKIFDKFRQANGSDAREFEGTGLGLALTRELVELHGGSIWLESEPGRGSMFTFSLPIEMPEGVREFDARHTPSVTASSITDAPTTTDSFLRTAGMADRPTILVVEDDPKASELLTIYLEEAEYNVIVAADGVDAVDKAKEVRPFAITLDVMLPKKDGWEVLRELKHSPDTKDIPVIIVSMIDDREIGFSLGAADHLVKPIDKRELIEKIRRCTSFHPKEKPFVVLAIDDDPKAVDLVAAILEPLGFGVLRAYGGQEGIDLAIECQPDLLLLDLMMPNVSGFEVIRALAEHPEARNIPIIILTAKELSAKDKQRLSNQIDRVMQKAHFTKDDLLREIAKLEKLNPDKALLLDKETGLFNYRYFKKRLAEESNRAERYKRTFSVMLVKVGLPERQNGANGESVMRRVGQLVEQHVRGADPIARYSNDQFVLVLPETTKEGAAAAGNKLRQLIETPATERDGLEAEPVALTIAISTYFEDATNGQDLLSDLTQKMETASREGGNPIVV